MSPRRTVQTNQYSCLTPYFGYRKDSRYIFLFDQPQAARASRFVKQNLCAPIVGCIVVLAVPVIDSRANIVLLPIAVRSGRGLCECSRLRSHTDLT